MPKEVMLLLDAPIPLAQCPNCEAKPFSPFMRGMVQRSPWTWRTLWLPIGKARNYCALICWDCKEIVGYE